MLLLHLRGCLAGGRCSSAAMAASDEKLTYEQHMEPKENLLLYLQHSAYVKLAASPIAGVGVFALRDIPAAVDPFVAPNQHLRRPEPHVLLTVADLARLPPSVHGHALSFFPAADADSGGSRQRTDGQGNFLFEVPSNGFAAFDASWYVNHAEAPNVAFSPVSDAGESGFRTLQAIPEGDELVVDYRQAFPDLYARMVAPRAQRRTSSPQMCAAPPLAPPAEALPALASASRVARRGGGSSGAGSSRLANAAILVAALVVFGAAAAPTPALAATATATATAERSGYELYPPRLLFPGTYGNFCGPTPEFPRGWRGDEPVDAVDRACQRHDASYDLCADRLRARRGGRELPVGRLLPTLAALRSTGLTDGVLEASGVDAEYRRCVHAADQGLIRDGLEVRRASQRAECAGDAFDFPRWFCELRSLTLARIERVDFDLFLADLDWDDRLNYDGARATGRRGLKQLEAARRTALNRAATRMPLSRAAESVRPFEVEMLERLDAE